MAKVNVRDRNKNKPDKKPNWEYRFEAASVGGKRKQFSQTGFHTKKEALVAGTKAYGEYLLSGTNFKPSELSVTDYFDFWLESYCRLNVADSTQDGYERIIRLHLNPKLGKYKLKNINTLVLQNLINDLALKPNICRTYAQKILNVLRYTFGYAYRFAHFIESDPARDVFLPRLDSNEKVFKYEDGEKIIILSQEQVADILTRFKHLPHDYYPMLIAYYSGLRIGEVYGLTWEDINFEKKTITVNKAVKKFSYDKPNRRGIRGQAQTVWYLGSCKTRTSYRTVPVGDTLLNALHDYKEWQANNIKEYGDLYTHCYLQDNFTPNRRKVKKIVQLKSSPGDHPELTETNMVCVCKDGQFAGPTIFRHASRVINHQLGIEFNFHAFRHTHATMLIESGLPIKTVSQRLGHSNTKTTWDFYVQVTEKMEVQAVETFEKTGALHFRDEYLYKKYRDMINCSRNTNYYKERNITVDPAWLDSFKEFENWSLENGYQQGLSILRIDKQKNFTADNCYWGISNKNVKGEHIYYFEGRQKSYSIGKTGRGYCYRITAYDDSGKRKDLSQAGFPDENSACLAAEEIIHKMFFSSMVS